MLSEATKQKLDEVVAAMGKEGYTISGVAVSPNGEEVQPFSNNTVIGEFVYNILIGAAMIADGIYDTAAIEKVAAEFLKQAQIAHEA